MNIRIQGSGLRVGDDQATDHAVPAVELPDVGIPGRNAGEGGHAGIEPLDGSAALNSSGLQVGGEAAGRRMNPVSLMQPSGTPSPRSRSDVAAAISRSALTGGAVEAKRTSQPMVPPLRQQKSAGNGGGEQAGVVAIPKDPVPAAKSSGRKAGASDAIRRTITEGPQHPGDKSGREVGDEQTNLSPLPKGDESAVHKSGASASGDEALDLSQPTVGAPRRKSPGRKAGADQAGNGLKPKIGAPDTQISGATRGDESHGLDAHQEEYALIAELVQLGRARRDWMKTRVGIELRAIAICRRFCAGDKDQAKVLWKAVKEGAAPDDLLFAVGPLLGPIATLQEQEGRVDRQMTKLAGKHKMAPWAKAIRGFGHAGLAKVIAECGDVGSYRGPARVWKRMGLAVINGGRQRRVPGAEALEHGYNAERRSVMWNVGGAVIGGMGRGPRPLVGENVEARDDLTYYQKLFVARLRYEAARDPDAHAREPVTNKETGITKESFSAHAANRAKRIVEKRLLRHLWQAWRRASREAVCPLQLDAEASEASRDASR